MIDSDQIQTIWGRVLHQICTNVDRLVIKQRLALNEGEQPDLEDPAVIETVSQTPSFYLMKLILNQFLPKALKDQTQTHRYVQMMLFADKLCRETEVTKYLHLVHPSQSIDQLVSELALHLR